MAKKVYEEENIRAIADKIREKTGGDLTYKPSEMPNGIDAVYEAGKAQGGDSYYDTFWDNYQQNGNRIDYQLAFGGVGWTTENFKPKYDIRPTKNVFEMFRGNSMEINLDEHLKSLGRELDFSNMNGSASAIFSNSKFTKLPILNFSTMLPAQTNIFQSCSKLEEIPLIMLGNDGVTTFNNWFSSCSALKEIRFEGVIGNNLDIHWSTRLTYDSLMSIIGALKPFVTYEEVITDFPQAQINCQIVEAGDKDNYYEWWEITSIIETSYGVLVTLEGAYAYPIDLLTGVNAMTLDEVPEYFKNATHYQLHSKEKGFSIKSVEAVPTGETRTLTLGETNLAKLTEAEKKTATDKGWVLV